MHKTIYKAVLMLAYLLALAPLAGLGTAAQAQSAGNDLDSLLIIPAVNDNADLDSLQTRLEFAAGAAFMEISILPIDPDFMPVPEKDGDDSAAGDHRFQRLQVLRQVAAQRLGRLLAVELDLLTSAEPDNLPVPAASVVDVESGQLVARTSTLPILEPENDMAVAAAAASLTRTLARQLEQNGYVLSAAAKKPWGGRTTQYRLALEGFDLCERRGLLATLESEFPGFVSIDLVKAPNPSFAVYLYASTATSQRMQKWLEQLMVSYGLASSPTSRLLVNDDSIRIQKDRATRIYSPLCDG